MALSQKQINIITDQYIQDLFNDMEREVIADIARRVQKTGRYTETAELMAKAMREQGYSTTRIQRDVMRLLRADKAYQSNVAQQTKSYKYKIMNIIRDTVKNAALIGNKLIGTAGDMAWNDDLSVWKLANIDLQRPKALDQLIKAYQRQTANQLRNLTRSTGFVGTQLGTTGILQAYRRCLDLATVKLSTGTFSYDDVVEDVVKQLAQSGLRTIDYASGKHYHLDTAARMCVRTGQSQLAGKITEMNIEKTGVELVYVDAHNGARPEHEVWQGKVYSYTGKNRKYPDFRKSTGYGTVAGLKGANCTHNFYPHWEGISTIPTYTPAPKVTVNGKQYSMYEATQKQRAMERKVRAYQREIDALKSVGKDTTETESKLNAVKRNYRSFSRAANLNTKENRFKTYE